MKTSQDPRHLKRVRAVQDLFAWDFGSDGREKIKKQPKNDLAKKVIENLEIIDQEVKKAAPTWPIAQINKIDLAILRLAIFELIIVKDTPYKVVVDEAVELAKDFGAESSSDFVNGVLGNVITAHHIG
jgi:transcription antitermination protein NusB